MGSILGTRLCDASGLDAWANFIDAPPAKGNVRTRAHNAPEGVMAADPAQEIFIPLKHGVAFPRTACQGPPQRSAAVKISLSLASSALLALCAAAMPALAHEQIYTALLSGAAENPANASFGAGADAARPDQCDGRL